MRGGVFKSAGIFTWWTSWVPRLEASAKASDRGLIVASQNKCIFHNLYKKRSSTEWQSTRRLIYITKIYPSRDTDTRFHSSFPCFPFPFLFLFAFRARCLDLELLQVLRRKLQTFIQLIRVGTLTNGGLALATSLAADGSRHGLRPLSSRSALSLEVL